MKANLTLFAAGISVAATALASHATWAGDVQAIADGEAPSYTAPVGGAMVETSRLAPFHARWTNNRPDEEGNWSIRGSFEEILEIDEGGMWRHTQITRSAGRDMVVTGVRLLDRETLRPIRFDRKLENGPPAASVTMTVEYSARGFEMRGVTADGKTTNFEKELSTPMFDGSIVGLTIAALPLEEGYFATMPTAIPALKATFWLEARVIGSREFVAANGVKIETWEVNAEWYNFDDKDIYPGGRDLSGGAYYIAKNPGDGVPFVVEYANDGTRISWDGERLRIPGSGANAELTEIVKQGNQSAPCIVDGYLHAREKTLQQGAGPADVSAATYYLAENAVYEHPRVGARIEGRAAIEAGFNAFLGGTRNGRYEIIDFFDHAGTVAIKYRRIFEALAKGGTPENEGGDNWKEVQIVQLTVFEVTDGKITHIADYW